MPRAGNRSYRNHTPPAGGIALVRRGDRFSVLPMHGGQKQLGTGLIAKIKKDLGLE